VNGRLERSERPKQVVKKIVYATNAVCEGDRSKLIPAAQVRGDTVPVSGEKQKSWNLRPRT